jgi:hypothetical protein
MEIVGSVLFVNRKYLYASIVFLVGNCIAYLYTPLLLLSVGERGVLCWIFNVPCIVGSLLLLLLPQSYPWWFLVVSLYHF